MRAPAGSPDGGRPGNGPKPQQLAGPGGVAQGGEQTVAEVDLTAFADNLRLARRLAAPAAVMAVLKADAYGHGAVALARECERLGCPLIGVATVEEGLSLRKSGTRVPLLVLRGVPEGAEEAVLENGLTATVGDEGAAVRLSRAGRRGGGTIPVHLEVDTGMGRLGVLPGQAAEVARSIGGLGGVRLEGVMTHFARADESDPEPTHRQAELFERTLLEMARAGVRPRWVHSRNSAALLRGLGSPGNLARPGIMLYGSAPAATMGRPEELGLRPVLTLSTRVAQVKEVPDGWTVSYGGLYRAAGPRRIAVLAAGYADGFLRYNGGGDVLIRGCRTPVVGRVCMDMAMIDVTGIPGVAPGDEAVLIGRQGTERILAEDVAGRGDTISYEVFCGISSRVPRIHCGGGDA